MGRKKKGLAVHGWLVLDKPLGVTSTQMVGRARRILNAQKVGHGGTLDPLATGILPLAFGEATKTVSYAMDGRKSYRFAVKWGAATSTDDLEGETIEESACRPSANEIREALKDFQGVIEQTPPRYSAIKIDGKRAYDLARGGDETFEIKSRQVRIDRFELIDARDGEEAEFEVDCGKGTYVRSLGRDLAKALGSCAHVIELRRTRVGPFTLEHAISLETLEEIGHSPAAGELLLPVETALDDISALALSETEATRLRQGQTIAMISRADQDRLEGIGNGDILLATEKGKPVALARYEKGVVSSVRVLNL
ncbi:tRNA pseudouridine(55) synthase TruB [Kiloniella laminariae]|uniref:tRNA pseudouridine synthase B n=1 Tax=Kiloniella laminariae TaxID=454162 RepID=A0ABT4LJN8_9PROT|nr:tRNA pseudouridine(55) synthase TruB [Kiloniella laminariae]MCZ4281317.1 tRNA pseudouridine(55) synthase TruB [Kiloniella laminariae]